MKKIVFFFWIGMVALLPAVLWSEGVFAQSELNFDASPTIGAPPLFVQLSSLMDIEEGDFYWEISDGRTLNGRRPVLRFAEAGTYTVKLTVTGNNRVYTRTQQNMITVYSDSMSAGLCHLELVDHSHTWVGETWDNAIDGDTYNKNGTVTAGRDPAFAIFEFFGGGSHTINKVRLLEKTFIDGNSNNWLKRFRILVATEGYYQHHFTTVFEGEKNIVGWEDFEFEPVDAKYIKLEVIDPEPGRYAQIGEFEVYQVVPEIDLSGSELLARSFCVADSVDSCEVLVSLADGLGEPVMGLPASAFRLKMTGGVYATTAFSEIDDGVYSGYFRTFMSGKRTVSVSVYNHEIYSQVAGDSIAVVVNCLEPAYQYHALEFIDGTECEPEMPWTHLIDGRISGISGTISAGPRWNDASAIFAFADGRSHEISRIRFLTDTGYGAEVTQTNQYRILISNKTDSPESFELLYDVYKDVELWDEFRFLPITCKYVKIELIRPRNHFRVAGELELYSYPEPNIVDDDDQEDTGKYAKENDDDLAKPLAFELKQNYPNPFNPHTTIEYQLAEDSQVQIRILNMLGQVVRTLENGYLTKGNHVVNWQGRTESGQLVSSGIYWCWLSAKGDGIRFSKHIKMMMLQ